MTYPKTIQRPYQVLAVTRKEWPALRGGVIHESWFEFLKAFHLEPDAVAFADRVSEDYQVVRIEKVG